MLQSAFGPVLVHSKEDIEDWTSQQSFKGRIFKDWLETFISLCKSNGKVVGLKLDFKAMECVSSTIDMVSPVTFPVWLNADVLQGPRGQISPFTTVLEEFICLCKSTGYVLSLGWTTGDVSHQSPIGYSDQMVQSMQDLLSKHELDSYPITFAVRGCDTFASIPQLLPLCSSSNRSITLWEGPERLSRAKVNTIIASFGSNSTFIDLPSLS